MQVMKKVLFLLFGSYLLASTHYAKLMPIESYLIQSSVSGKVISVQKSKEGKRVENELIVQVDDRVDKAELKALQTALKQVRRQLQINQEIEKNLTQSLKRQESHFRRIDSLQTRPQSEKDSAFYNFINAQNQLLHTQEKIATLIEKEEHLAYSIANLEDIIAKKRFVASGFVRSIEVKEGEYLNPGKTVLRVDDLSKGKLTIYLSSDELEKSEVYIEGKKHEAGFDKVWQTTDDVYISAYKAEIILDDVSGFRFGQLLQIEVK